MTFFSEKGGVGKTTFNIMYASWLKYKNGVNVVVADFNERIVDLRKKEMSSKKKLGTWEEFKDKDLWEIIQPTTIADYELIDKYNKIEDGGYVEWTRRRIINGKLDGVDVLLLDFPGSLSGGEYTQFLVSNWLGMTVIPIDRDPMTITSAVKLHIWLDGGGHNHMAFLNQIKTSNSKSIYTNMKDKFEEINFRVLPDMVSQSERIKKIEDVSIIRSTFEFPDWDQKCFAGNRDLGIENLFIDVTRELVKTPDILETPEADLSFIKSIEKERNDSRQLVGTSFPEYEMDVKY